ncbi:MAG: ABC transporter ATP-binding protein [Marvinbryantia sp.]|jgi:iron complex transport system ATP-binding protein
MGLIVKNFSAGYAAQKKNSSNAIVKNVSFSLNNRTLTALIGANGCGKSTLLKGICRLIPSSGTVLFQETTLDKHSEQLPLHRLTTRQIARLISYIPQRSGISVSLSALDIVLMGFHPYLGLLESPGKLHREKASIALEMVGLADQKDQDFLTLSEGQKQLCILARTLVQDTCLMLFDEPDSALDFSNRQLLLQTIREVICTRNKTGLLVLHDINLALDYCDQLLIMKDGKIIQTLYPKIDSEKLLSESLSVICGNVEVFHRNGHCMMYPKNTS